MTRNFSKRQTITGSELIPLYDQYGDSPLWATPAQLVTYFQSAFTSPTYTTTINVPVNGFSLSMTDDSTNQWLLLQPAGTLATGTVVLPLSSGCADGQEVLITSTEDVTTLTINTNGATAAHGAPTTVTAAAPIKLRYNLISTSWYKVI